MLKIWPEFSRKDKPYRLMVWSRGQRRDFAPSEVYYFGTIDAAKEYGQALWWTEEPGELILRDGDELIVNWLKR